MFPVRHINFKAEPLPSDLGTLLKPPAPDDDAELHRQYADAIDELTNFQLKAIHFAGANGEHCNISCRYRGADMSFVGWFTHDGVLYVQAFRAEATPAALLPDRDQIARLIPFWTVIMRHSLNPLTLAEGIE